MARDQININDLCRWFAVARKFREAASEIGIVRHPDILEHPLLMKRGGGSKLHPIITKVFYGCTVVDMYRSLKEHAKHDEKLKGIPWCMDC